MEYIEEPMELENFNFYVLPGFHFHVLPGFHFHVICTVFVYLLVL